MTEFDPPYPGIRAMGFPTVEQLRNGIILGCIAHSFWLIANEPVSERFWDRDTYLDDECQGERWSVAFTKSRAVAVFYSTESSRNPWPKGSPPYNQSFFFQGMPHSLTQAKERALSWMPNLDDKMGGPNAVITAAMWADGDRFTAIEPWVDVFDHSLWACATQLMPLEEALLEWWNGMELPGNGMEVTKSLFQRRMQSSQASIDVTPEEVRAYVEAAQFKVDSRKAAAARDLLTGIGIVLPARLKS